VYRIINNKTMNLLVVLKKITSPCGEDHCRLRYARRFYLPLKLRPLESSGQGGHGCFVLCCVVLCFMLCYVVLCCVVFVARSLVFGKSVGPAWISKVSILERRNSKN